MSNGTFTVCTTLNMTQNLINISEFDPLKSVGRRANISMIGLAEIWLILFLDYVNDLDAEA
jgi:hypothetical protein